MSRIFHLGVKGEDAAADILTAYQLGSQFESCYILSPHEKVLMEIQLRLREQTESFAIVDAFTDLGDQFQELSTRFNKAKSRPVVWIQPKKYQSKTWQLVLIYFNQLREWIKQTLPAFVVLAGPPKLLELVHKNAPDFWSIRTVVRILTEEPTEAPAGKIIRWLHLSDLHISGIKHWENQPVLQSLYRDVVGYLKAHGLIPDMIMVTGDIAWSGQDKEYEQAERFFTAIANEMNQDPSQCWFIVPGNHDINRHRIGPMDDVLLHSLNAPDLVDKVIQHPPTMKMLSNRLKAFYNFTERFLGPVRSWKEETPWRTDIIWFDGLSVGVLQMNSVWGLHGDRLLIGQAQVEQLLKEASPAFLKLALLHHPRQFFQAFENVEITRLLQAQGVGFLLHGHNPYQLIPQEVSNSLLVSLSATHYRCALTSVNLVDGIAEIYPFEFDESQQTFAPQIGTHSRHWTLPQHLQLGDFALQATAPLSNQLLAAKYRQSAAAIHGTIRFIGFADPSSKPNIKVPELFVPLHLKVDPHWNKTDKHWSTAQLAQELLEPPSEGHSAARLVVLGDPGSGKTTLCRFLTVLIAGGAELKDVEVNPNRLPFFLPYREYVHQWQKAPKKSIIRFLYDQARSHLAVQLPEGFIESVFQSGQAVLLLDGLDEVGKPEDRLTMRDMVEYLAQTYPLLSILVTSRIAGYTDAPLRPQDPDSFAQLSIAPFSRQDLTEFVTHWYTLQEPEDAVQRDKGVAHLMASIRAEPRIAALAQNPLLATLIALIDRFEAHLPGERVKLFELCVKTMLETWPAAREQRFTEIDEGLQRVYLEHLAYHMQLRRQTGDSENVLLDREKLIEILINIMTEFAQESLSRCHQLAEKWVSYLEAGTGLMVEHQTGLFGFFHLSLMEYLAAVGMTKTEGDNLAEEVVKYYSRPAWQEVCLLVVGLHATSPAFLHHLFDKMTGHELSYKWIFLLKCLREEAAFNQIQRSRILENIVSICFGAFHYPSDMISDTLYQIFRFSVRNGSLTRQWFYKQLETQNGEALAQVVRLSCNRFFREQLTQNDILNILNNRQDIKQTADILFDFWPFTQVGDWAIEQVDKVSLWRWIQDEASYDLLALRCLRAFLQTELDSLYSGLCLAIVEQALTVGKITTANYLNLQVQFIKHSGSWECEKAPREMEKQITVLPGGATAKLLLHLPVQQESEVQKQKGEKLPDTFLVFDFQRVFHNSFFGKLYIARNFIHVKYPDMHSSIAGTLLSRLLSFEDDFTNFFSQSFFNQFAKDFAQSFLSYNTFKFLKKHENYFDILFDKPKESFHTTNFSSEEDPQNLVSVIAPLLANIWAALITTHGLPEYQRLRCIIYRLHNQWLLDMWASIDEKMTESISPDKLALYLAIGWVQFTTTWQWPESEKWKELFHGKSPEHWFPRAQWYFAHLTDEPENTEYKQALYKSLDEGLSDPERRLLAQQLYCILH